MSRFLPIPVLESKPELNPSSQLVRFLVSLYSFLICSRVPVILQNVVLPSANAIGLAIQIKQFLKLRTRKTQK